MTHDASQPRHLLLPQPRFDELIDEVVGRLEQVEGVRGPVRQLLKSVLAVSGRLDLDPDLDQVLRTVVETAAELIGTRYGAPGVIGGEAADRLERFLTISLTSEQIEATGPHQTRTGILGQLIGHPVPPRPEDVAAIEASGGFPAGHSPMRAFPGAPIRGRDEVYDDLHLAGKRDGALFDADDGALLNALAAAAGAAIDNARLYGQARRRQLWMEAAAELTRGLLAGSDPLDVLTVLIDRVLPMTDADLLAVMLPDPAGRRLTVQVARGPGSDRLEGLTVPAEGSPLGRVLSAGTAGSLSGPDWAAYPVWTDVGLGSAYVVPLGVDGSSRGVLVAARRVGAPPFDVQVVKVLGGVGGQVAIALELARRREDAEKLALFADRDRIGRDLHDLAIQRLFAAGMTLQSVLRLTEDQVVRDRVATAVADLDDTIKAIRSTVFALSGQDAPARIPGLRAEVLQLCQDAAEPLGFAPAVRFTGPVDFEVPEHAVDHVLAVAREALSNITRHAHASAAQVDLATSGGGLVLRIADNGVGIPPDGRRSGLANIAERAAELHGTCDIAPGADGGAVLTWTIPIDEDA